MEKMAKDTKNKVEIQTKNTFYIKVGAVLIVSGVAELILLIFLSYITLSYIFFILLYPFIALCSSGIYYLKYGSKDKTAERKSLYLILFFAAIVIAAGISIELLIQALFRVID